MEARRDAWAEKQQQDVRKETKAGRGSPKRKAGGVPPHKMYPRYLTPEEERLAQLYKPTPSMIMEEMDPKLAHKLRKAAAPEILEFVDEPNLKSTVPADEPIFQPFPLHVQFRDYAEFGEYKQTLRFRNNDSVPRRIRVIPPDSQHFALRSKPRSADRIAPGMEVTFEVTFKPHEKREYRERLVCVTDRERFAVELSAVGPFCCLDLPDEIGFGTCAVQVPHDRTFLVRNIGEQDTRFTLRATPPFTVGPASGFIKLGHSTQVTVGFLPELCTEYDGELEVEYENGQKAYVHLHGSAEDIRLSLDKPIAEMDSAYITLTSTATVRIHNDSDTPVEFCWKSFASSEEDERERARLNAELDRLEALELEDIHSREYERDAVPESPFLDGEDSEDSESEGPGGEDYGGPDGAGVLGESEHDLLGAGPPVGGSWDETHGQGGARSGRRMPHAKRRDLSALKQKFKMLRRAVNEDDLLFTDENFSIEPLSGQVWSQSSKEIKITFRPMVAADYVSIANLFVQGRESRLPLKILGQGIGPKAAFSFHIVDVGNVFVRSAHTYELQLENRGDIECAFSLDESESPLAKCISFAPQSSVLAVEESKTIAVEFCSDILGEFNEQFTFSMKGSNEKLRVRLKGNVIGPTFHLNIQELKFDRIAYGFCNTRTFNIHNTSAISMDYVLRVPADGKFDIPEFVLTPSSGHIPPGQHQAIKLDFTSRTVIRYSMELVVDVVGIGNALYEVPITAECAVPTVSLVPSHIKRVGGKDELATLLGEEVPGEEFADSEEDELDDTFGEDGAAPPAEIDPSGAMRPSEELTLSFGRCFVRHPYIMPLTLRNTTDIKAFFEIQKQDESTFCVATYEPALMEGTIEPMSEINVDITLKCAKLGKMSLPMYVKILGSDKPPLMIDITAVSKGPRVVVEPQAVDFGAVTCLETATKTFTLHNKSLIPAPYRTFLKGAKTRFHIDTFEGCLGPGECLDCVVSVCSDDSVPHRDEMHVLVTEGESIIVPLRAKGRGTTIFCKNLSELETCDFGNVFTSRQHEVKFLLENRGRREQALTWTNLTVQAAEALRSKAILQFERMMKDKDPEVQKKAAKRRIPSVPAPTFTVHPESVLLKPRMGCMVTVRAESDVPGLVEESLLLESKVGKDKKAITVLESTAKANLVNPLLHSSIDVIEFCYTFNPDEADREARGMDMTQQRPFKLKNISELKLDFILRTQEPFSVDTWEITLEPGEEINVTVMFDPFLNDDLKTQTITRKLLAVHKNHPQKDSFDIRAQINFPNLDFEYDEVDFGCVMNDTSKTMRVKMTNNSIIDTMYSWVFVEEERRMSSEGKRKDAGAARLSPNEVFDIRPIRGLLRPGESQDVEVSFFGHTNQKFNALAVCEVEGGPEYELKLKGEAAKISYRLDQTALDFGEIVHDKTEEKTFTVYNTSKVSFGFRAISSRSDVVACTPSEGRIFAKDSQKITVRFSPGIPDAVERNIMLEVAHFEPVAIPVCGRGIYASVTLNLPRAEEVALAPPGTEDGMLLPAAQLPVDTDALDPVELEAAREWMGLLAEAEESLREGTEEEDPEVEAEVKEQKQGTSALSSRTATTAPPKDSLDGAQPAKDGIALSEAKEATEDAGAATVDDEAKASLENPEGSEVPQEAKQPSDQPTGGAEAEAEAEAKTDDAEAATGTAGSSEEPGSVSGTAPASKEVQADKGAAVSGEVVGRVSPAGKRGNNSNNLVGKKGPRFDEHRVRIESEANRLRFVRFLQKLEKQREEKASPGPAARPELFAIATYVVDFGNVVIGKKARKKPFRILNTSSMDLSLEVDKSALAGTTFSIDPARISFLKKNGTAEVTVQFVAKRDAVLGPVSAVVPIDIRSGPPIRLELRANVTMPDMSVSTDALDFDSIIVGQCKVMTVQLKNISPVPVDWAIPRGEAAAASNKRGPKTGRRAGQDAEPSGSGDLHLFTCKPMSGKLDPMKRVNVEVTFTPGEERDFQARLPFKILNNPKAKYVTCKGAAKAHTLKIEQQLLKLSPTLPSLSDSAFQDFAITNASDHAVEVFSVDFDTVYEEEEAKLTAIFEDMPDRLQDNVLRSMPRACGEALPQSIEQLYREVARKRELAAAKEAAARKAEEAALLGDEPVLDGEEAGVGEIEDPAEAAAAAAPELGLDEPEELKPTYRDRGLALDAVVHAPPLCGLGEKLSQLLAEHGGNLPVITLDEVFEWAAERALLDPEVAEFCQLQQPSEVPADEKSKKKKGVKKRPITHDELVQIVRRRIAERDCGSGLVLNSLATRYMAAPDFEAAALAVREAFVPPVCDQGGENEGEGEPSGDDPASTPSTSDGPFNTLRVIGVTGDQAWLNEHLAGLKQRAAAADDATLLAHVEEMEARVGEVSLFLEQLDAVKTVFGDLRDEIKDSSPGESKSGENEEKGEGEPSVEPLDTAVVESTVPKRVETLWTDSAGLEWTTLRESIAAWLPAPGTPLPDDWDEFYIPIPPEKTFQLLKRPAKRPPRQSKLKFALETLLDSPAPSQEIEDSAPDGEVLENGAETSQEALVDTSKTRWVIPAHSELKLRVRFRSTELGNSEQQLTFEAVGGQRQYWAIAQGTCTVPRISSDPRNVFMNRIKSRPEHKLVSNKFVMSRRTYEFGPLLIGRDAEARHAEPKLRKGHCETFRISNSGILPIEKAELHFVLADAEELELTDESLLPFMAEPSELELEPNETKDVDVWAFPQAVGSYTAKLVILVKDNPEAVEFNLSCVGASPEIAVEGPWDDKIVNEEAAADEAEVPKKGKDAKKKGGSSAPVECERTLDFDRLLLGRNEERGFTVRNTCKISVHWQLDLGELAEMEEFSIFPTSGALAPGEAANVTVNFTAKETTSHEQLIHVRFQDLESAEAAAAAANAAEDEGGDSPSAVANAAEAGSPVPVLVRAEGYQISVDASFAQEGDPAGEDPGMLNFGTIRVFEQGERKLKVRNNGKYLVHYKFNIRKRATRELISVTPSAGELEPGQEEIFTFSFSSRSEVSLRNNKDIQCIIMEPMTGKVEETFEVPVFATTMLSAFHLQPSKGIHFGAVKFDSTPEKSFEIKNDGAFDFSYELIASSELEKRIAELAEAEQAFEAEQADKGDEAQDLEVFRLEKLRKLAFPQDVGAGGPAALGPFTIEPKAGVVPVGGTQTVKVQFKAEGDEHASERVYLMVSGTASSTDELLSGVPFDFAGESHVPGINTANYESIFEEQAVVRALEPDSNANGVFSTESRTFAFGAVVHTSVPQQGVCERFKISNPNKIKAEVNFNVEPRTKESEGVFSVQPAHLELPSHEYAFVTVYFKPNAMRQFSAKFSAVVVDGESNPRTQKLEFDIQGEGTLPCLTIVEPAALSDAAKYVVDHGRTQIGKCKTRVVTVRNDGIVPATIRFDMPVSEAFSFPLRNGSMTLAPKEAHSTTMSFRPQNQGEQSCELLLRVLHNEFELSRFEIRGEGFQEDINFEELPDGAGEDALDFGDVPLLVAAAATGPSAEGDAEGWEESDANGDGDGDPTRLEARKTIRFAIRSNVDVPLRFEWDNEGAGVVQFSPGAGHLGPFGVMHIEASLVASEPLSLSDAAAKVMLTRIKYREEAFAEAAGNTIEWNSSMLVAPSADAGEGADASAVAPEPPFDPIEDAEPSTLALVCKAEVDTVRYELPEEQLRELRFRPTMMFQSRVFKYTVKNASRTSMHLDWAIRAESASLTNTHCPFTVTPASAVIEPDTDMVFLVRFSPLEVEPFAYTAVAAIKHLCGEQEQLTVSLAGEAQRPVCHFEMEPSTYLERRKAAVSGVSLSGDSSVRVLEFKTLGVRMKNTKRFHVVNPMNVAHKFELVHVGDPNPRFKCLTEKGTILPGKRCELAFTFTPDGVDTQESMWQFRIAEQRISQDLLLVGSVSEPRVEMEKKHVNFHSVLVDGQSDEVVNLVNHESTPFAFSFDAGSFVDQETSTMTASSDSGGKKQRKVLRIEPMSGTVGANSSLPLRIRFAPGSEKPYNFNLVCVVHRKPNRLSLNVKGEGSAVHDFLSLETESDEDQVGADGPQSITGEAPSAIVLAHGDGVQNDLNFGPVHVNDQATRRINIQNRGRFSFDFVWSLPAAYGELDESLLRLEPVRGTVPPGERLPVTLTFSPKREVSLDNLKFQCTVAGARKYHVTVNGTGAKPQIRFSSSKFDFGPCFLAERGTSSRPEEQVLVISNNETENAVALDCVFEKTDFLDVNCEPTVLQPGESVQVPIRFTPRELKQYSGSIPFEVNGLYTVSVLFQGEGTKLRLELEDPEKQTVNFGSLRVGQHVTKTFRIVNRSMRSASFSLEDPKVAGQGRLEQRSILLSGPSHSSVTLRAREGCTFSLTFAPEVRQSPFQEPLNMVVNGHSKELLTVAGSCQAEDVKLELNSLSFGSVCESCRVTRKVQLQNGGDLGARFRWEMPDRHGRTEFSIFPMEGFLPAHSQLMVDVTFHPSKVADELRSDLRLVVDGSEQVVHPLAVSGSCMPQPEDGIKELRFETKVRVPAVQTIAIENPTRSPWLLQPTIHNKCWSGKERLEVPAGGTASYEVRFFPLSMRPSGRPASRPSGDVVAAGEAVPAAAEDDAMAEDHQGSVFFALPNGNAILYKLVGKALAPDAEGQIEESTTSKAPMVIPLPVKNWFRTAQRMAVTIERIAGTDDHFFKGSKSLDVPGNSTRDYKLNFVGYLEGTSEARVTFTNVGSGEYLFYTIKMKVEPPKLQGSLAIEAVVRQAATAVITIENPFYGTQRQVEFGPKDDRAAWDSAQPSGSWWSCDSPFVRVRALNEIAENREGLFEVEYRPLRAGNETVALTLKSEQLGTYPYELELRSTPTQTDRSLQFRAALGASHEQVFRFTSFVAKPTEYACKVDQPLFFAVPASVKTTAAESWMGSEVAVTVRFEPQCLGEVRDVLTVTSPDGGEYTCTLYGTCEPPRPQGPFDIADAAKGVGIDFKNVFDEAKEFKCIVDSDEFTVNGARSQLLKVDAGKSVTVTVKSTAAGSAPVTGKLLVHCVDTPQLPAWAYYIRSAPKP